MLRGARAAVVFLTRIPVGGWPFTAGELRWAGAWFSVVGALLGLLLAAVWMALSRVDPLARATFTVLVGILVTGALHEDGLADTADALGASQDRKRVLEILKDSRIGTFGAVAVVISILSRVALLAGLQGSVALALILAHSVSRTIPLWIMAALPYITDRENSKSRGIVDAGLLQALIASSWIVVALGGVVWFELISGRTAGAVLASAVVTGVACAAVFQRRMGGVTGDFLGAVQQMGEIAVLLAIAVTVVSQ